MRKMANKIISCILTVSLICSMSITAFAENLQQSPNDIYSVAEDSIVEALRNQCDALTLAAKTIFLQAISDDPELAAYYRENVDAEFVPMLQPENLMRSVTINSTSPLKQLEYNLKALSLPTAVVVSLMAVGSGFVAATADGPLVFGDAYLAVTAAGAAAVIGLNWTIVSPKFPSIVSVFKQCFKDSVSVITNVFDKLKSEAIMQASAKERAEDAAKDVSNSVKKNGSKDTVDLDRFKDKNGRTPKNKDYGRFTSEKDSRYTIEKDTAGHTGYDGTKKEWKLFRSGKRVASLNNAGKIVGD